MLRLLSFLLIMLGLAAVSYGGYQYLQSEQSSTEPVVTPPGSVCFDTSAADTPVPATSRSLAGEAASAKSGDDEFFGVASVDDSFMSALRTVPIAHETPSSAQYGRPFNVTVAVDATGDSSAADALNGNGNIVEGEARVSSSVQVRVSGTAFDVVADGPIIQQISPLTENIWRFRVTPTAVGDQELVIELFAMMENNQALPLRTFRDSVTVNVSRIGKAIAIARSVSPITVVAGGIGSLLAGLFGFIGFFRR